MLGAVVVALERGTLVDREPVLLPPDVGLVLEARKAEKAQRAEETGVVEDWQSTTYKDIQLEELDFLDDAPASRLTETAGATVDPDHGSQTAEGAPSTDGAAPALRGDGSGPPGEQQQDAWMRARIKEREEEWSRVSRLIKARCDECKDALREAKRLCDTKWSGHQKTATRLAVLDEELFELSHRARSAGGTGDRSDVPAAGMQHAALDPESLTRATEEAAKFVTSVRDGGASQEDVADIVRMLAEVYQQAETETRALISHK